MEIQSKNQRLKVPVQPEPDIKAWYRFLYKEASSQALKGRFPTYHHHQLTPGRLIAFQY